MSHLYLTVELSAGTDIRDACEEAYRLAQHLQVSVSFDHNGCKHTAYAGEPLERFLSRVDDERSRFFKNYRSMLES